MSDNKKKLAKNSLVYAFFTLLQRGFAFFLIPIYATKLSTEEYGLLGIIMAAIPFLVLVAGVSFRGSTAYFYRQYNEDANYVKDLLGTAFSFVLIISLLFSLLLWATREYVLQYVLEDIDFYPYLFLALISVGTQPIYLYYQSILKAKQLAKKSASLDFIYFSIIVGLTIILILGYNFKAEGALLALAVSNFLFFGYSIWSAKSEVNFVIKKDLLKKTLKYSLPILPHNLSAWAMNLVDRIIINKLATLSLVGIFDMGSQIGKLINIITLGVNSAYSPWFFEQLKKDKDNKKLIADVTIKIIIFYIVVAVSISWLSPELLFLIADKSFYSAWKVVPLITFAFVVNGFYYSFSNVFFLEKTKYLPFITITGALINIGLNFLLIPSYGIMGAAIASILSKVVFSLIAYVVSQKLYFIPYKIYTILGLISIGFLVSSLLYIIQPKIQEFNVWFIIMLKALSIIILISPLIWFNKEIIILYIRRSILKRNGAKE